jgi:putative acetyltransferase
MRSRSCVQEHRVDGRERERAHIGRAGAMLAAMSQSRCTIRAETTADARAIEAVTTAAFLNASHTSRSEQHIVNALRAAGKLTVSLVAESDGVVVGHVAISPVSISDGTPGWFGLGPVSVLPGLQGGGIGSRLVREALRILRDRQAAGCVVLGAPEYYGRFGFAADSNLIFPGPPAEYFQAIAFHPANTRGTVTYHEAFEAQG